MSKSRPTFVGLGFCIARLAVCNFALADFHTYYVTEADILVHNCRDLPNVTNWSPNSVITFGHTFSVHGKSRYKNLVGRLQAGDEQGHFLNNKAVADYLKSLGDEINKLAPGEAATFDLPDGLGQVLSLGDAGEVITTAATKIVVVRVGKNTNKFIKTAFPVLH